MELADTDETRAKGLMFRSSMPRFSGMLFVYPKPTWARFWMKNTLIPLDMIFMDPAGIVRGVHHNAIPHDRTSIDGGRNILSVLEINGGMARKLGITEGSLARHPALGPEAVWPCD